MVSYLFVALLFGLSVPSFSSKSKQMSAQEFVVFASNNMTEYQNLAGSFVWKSILDVSNAATQKMLDDIDKQMQKTLMLFGRIASQFDLDRIEDLRVKEQLEFYTAHVQNMNKIDANIETRYHNLLQKMQKLGVMVSHLVPRTRLESFDIFSPLDCVKYNDYRLLIAKSEKIKPKDATNAEQKLKEYFEEFVEVANMYSKELGFNDFGEYMRDPYNVVDVVKVMRHTVEELEPFYREYHAFIRLKNRAHIKLPEPDGTMIVNDMLLGMQAPPIDNVVSNITEALLSQGYTHRRTLEQAEKFFLEIGMFPLPNGFFEKSNLRTTRPNNMQCNPLAAKIRKDDYRISLCEPVSEVSFRTLYHEMGHVQYFSAYEKQPYPFRSAPHPSFTEAIGDTVALSAMSPAYLKSINLLDDVHSKNNSLINKQFLELNIVKILSIYILERWRWSVFDGTLARGQYSHGHSELLRKYLGVAPKPDLKDDILVPLRTTQVYQNEEIIKYFFAEVLKYQFYKGLCKKSNQPVLHECTIQGNKHAGQVLREMLSLGASVGWQEQLKLMTGTEHISASAMLEYYAPLRQYFRKTLASEKIGWKTEEENAGSQNELPSYEDQENGSAHSSTGALVGLFVFSVRVIVCVNRQFEILTIGV